MKNFLKISPEEWRKERAVGQISFVVKQTIVFSIILLPLYSVFNYLMLSEKGVFRIAESVIPAIGLSFLFSITQRAGLESDYRKNAGKVNSDAKV